MVHIYKKSIKPLKYLSIKKYIKILPNLGFILPNITKFKGQVANYAAYKNYNEN